VFGSCQLLRKDSDMPGRASGLAPFSAALAQHAGFRAVLEIVAGSFDDVVCLEVTPKGISVNSVDKVSRLLPSLP